MTLLAEFSVIREGVDRVSERGIDLPVDEVMLARKVKHLGLVMTTRLQRVLQPHGLVEADFSALMQLFGSPSRRATPGALCGLTAQHPTNMTRIADALVRKKLATRATDATDRRRVILRITARGERLARALLPQLGAEIQGALAAMSTRDKRQLDRLLQRMAASLDTHIGESRQ